MLILDKKRILNLMKSFYMLTSMPLSVLDLDGKTHAEYPAECCEFCRTMRKDAAFFARCAQCDRENFAKCRASSQPTRYTCHAGLIEMISPVLRDGVTLCYIMVGQALDEATAEVDRMRIFQSLRGRYGLEEAELARVINRIPAIGMDKIIAYQTLFEAVTLYLHSTRVVALTDVEFISRLDNYIDSNIDSPIRVNDLCAYFNMSRTQFYETSRSYLNTPLTTYIRGKRIRRAQALLREGNESITRVAELCGFEDYSYFCHVFKQTTGTQPRRYRQDTP